MEFKKRFKLAALLMGVLAMTSLVACSTDDDDEDKNNSTNVPKTDDEGQNNSSSVLKTTRLTLSRKTEYGNDWIYFSLSQGKEITVSEDSHATDTSWDLAFNRYNIRTNSGASGSGKGGALDTGLTDFDAVTTVPSGTFTVDEEAQITGSFTGNGITYAESTLNKVLAEAIAFAGPPPSYTPNNHVYIVKTADGKYAKLQVEGFYNDEGKSGYMTFKFAYQPDGSTNLATK